MAREANRGDEKPQGGGEYQVFLSFRGCDTRQGFTDCLYHFLVDAGVRVFRDNEELRPVDKIEEVLTAIDKASVCIPILSQNYASSKWCLLELAEMVKLKKDIMPVFYRVTADDVKLKTNLYSDHLRKLGEEYDTKKVEWERALKEAGAIFDAAQLGGTTFKEVGPIKAWTIMDYPGYGELSKEVVREILGKLEVKPKISEGPLIGIDDHVEAMMKLLDIGSPDVRYAVIHGVGGVGKTTLAKAILSQYCGNGGGFHRCCFLDNVRETANDHGIVHLQNKLLRGLRPRIRRVYDSDSATKTIKDVVKNKMVLIILDDLDHREQIEGLAGDSTWFGSGSRIIVTTRDPSCISKLSNVWDYSMSEMSPDRALQLFCRHAFKMESPPNTDCLNISKEATAACGGLPLALEVMGSYLHHVDKQHWNSKIKKIASLEDVQEKLMISIKTLDPRIKEIFLDIACFFVGRDMRFAVHMWEACDLRPDEGIRQLLSMSLIKISEDSTFLMHDLLQEIGREIVILENLKRPEKRSRLWSQKEVERVLWREKGTGETDALRVIRSCNLDSGIQRCTVKADQIRPLQNLRFLELDNVYLDGDFKGALQDLKWLSWNCMGEYQATNLALKDLVILELSSSNINDEWLNTVEIGENLKVFKLKDALPFRPRGRKVDIRMGLTKLTEILKNLSPLVELEISCLGLQDMPVSIGHLKNLRVMKLNNSSISELPNSIGGLEMLEELHAKNSTLKCIPEDIGRLHQLRIIDLSSSDIGQLPSTICELPRLQHLRLESCDGIQELPDLPPSLIILRVSSKSLRKFPNLSNLQHLSDLRLFGSIHASNLLEQQHLTSGNPNWINNCPSLESFELGCRSIISLEMETTAFRHLKQLKLYCPDLEVVGQLPLSLTRFLLSANIEGTALPKCLGEMAALNDLELQQCTLTDELPLPRNLKSLRLHQCSVPQQWLDLSGVKMLQYLAITSCNTLKEVRGIENMKSLEKLRVMDSPFLGRISDLSKFERLIVTTDKPKLFKGNRKITLTLTSGELLWRR